MPVRMSQVNGIHPKLIPYIHALMSYEFGLLGASAEIKNIECGSIVAKDEKRYGDRFYIKIPFCSRILNWQVLMYPYNLLEPPDFIMEGSFLADVDVNLIESQVPSLVHWQPADPKCLVKVVVELLELYKHFQDNIITMNQDSRLCFEYKALLNCRDLSDLEIYCHNPSRVSFLTYLNIDPSKLPMYLPQKKYYSLLLIEIGENTGTIATIKKLRDLDEVFGNVDLPELRNDMMLIEYISLVEDILQSQINRAVKRYEQRKLLYSYFLQVFEPAILNGDNIMFQSLSFLIENDGFYYVVNIEIPLNFPEDVPEISISAMRPGIRPHTFYRAKKFKYNSHWNMDKIFKSIHDFIKHYAINEYEKFFSGKRDQIINEPRISNY